MQLKSLQYHVFYFCVHVALKLVTCSALFIVITTLWIGITFTLLTGVRIHYVVRVKTSYSLIESDESLRAAVFMGSQKCNRSGVTAWQLRGTI
jgi:hypothetical protein